jgi:hypothetical protein
MAETIIVAGSLAQRPFYGGHTWVFLQYLLGFRKLGWEVLFVDRLEPGMSVDIKGQPTSFESSINLRYTADVMERFGLGQDWALLYNGGSKAAGRSRPELLERVRRSAMLLNVMGFLDDEEILGLAPLRVFLDIDPGFGQIWHELGLHELPPAHDRYVTVGERIGDPSCEIPTCGIDWLVSRPPVVLDQWPVADSARRGFTSVASWRGPFGPLEYRGRTYGLRVHEFRRFLDLPERTAQRFEVALDIDDADEKDLRRLRRKQWSVVDPRRVAGDPWRYRDYVQSSAAEVMIAKNLYVDTRSGWFSDRSVCYLASGKPVLAQDTGLDGLLPGTEGLLTFSTLDEAQDAVEAIVADYPRHSRTARELALEYFATDRVLPHLLERVGIG